MDFNIFGILAMPTLAVICYLLGMGIKVSKIDDKYIPVACGTFGAILGIVAYVCDMSGFPAQNITTQANRKNIPSTHSGSTANSSIPTGL